MNNKLIELNKIIEKDTFDDAAQNQNIYSNDISGRNCLLKLLEFVNTKEIILNIGCGSSSLPQGVSPATHAIEPNEHRMLLHQKNNPNAKVLQAYSEDIPFSDGIFDIVITWGVLCFVRSLMESMYEANRVLKMGGNYIFDVVIFSTMPIVQTVEPSSFLRWCSLFGFSLVAKINFGEPYHKRLGVCMEKIDTFDHRKFLMPQCGVIKNNFLECRDWFLQ